MYSVWDNLEITSLTQTYNSVFTNLSCFINVIPYEL